MTTELEKFILSARQILGNKSEHAALDDVRHELEYLLKDKDFINENFGDSPIPGTTLLFEDPSLGFQIISYAMDKPIKGGPHDHGNSWAIYGQALGWTEMTEWEREENPEDPSKGTMKAVKTYRLEGGMAGIFREGDIHSISYPGGACFIRITGCDLSKIPRGRYNLQDGTVEIGKRPNFDGTRSS